MSRSPMVEHDDRIVSFVRLYRRQHGYGPSYREIAEETGTAVSTTAGIIARLVEEGRLAHVPRIPRTVALNRG